MRRYLDNKPVLATPPSSIYRLRKPSRKLAVAGAALVVLVALAILDWKQRFDQGIALNLQGDAHSKSFLAKKAEREQLTEQINLPPEVNLQPAWSAERFELEDRRDALNAELNRVQERAVTAYLQAKRVAPENSAPVLAASKSLERIW